MMPPDVTALLRELIRIPSVNPDGSPGTTMTGEKPVADYLGGLLAEMGADVSMHDVLPGRPNVVARFPSNHAGKPRLLFAPHTDTVSIVGMTIDPFAGDVRDGKIWGRGASDTKGSAAAMLFALYQSLPLLPDLPYEIWFAGLMGEEAGLLGSKALAGQMPFDFVIAGEPTDLDVVHATKGSVWTTLKTSGRAVHASTPENGENAIYAMADLLRCVRDDIAPNLKNQTHPILGSPTISAGVISGGSKINIVPDACEVSLDMRTIPGQDINEIFNQLRHVVPTVDIEFWESKPLMTSTDHPVIAAMESCGSRCVGAPWFCDAANFASHGVPSIAVGPGSIAQAHTKDEFLRISDLEEGVRFFSAFLGKL